MNHGPKSLTTFTYNIPNKLFSLLIKQYFTIIYIYMQLCAYSNYCNVRQSVQTNCSPFLFAKLVMLIPL